MARRRQREAVLARQLETRRSFKQAALIRQSDTTLFEAERALKRGDYLGARQRAERVVAAAAYVEDAARAAGLRARAEALMAEAREEAQREGRQAEPRESITPKVAQYLAQWSAPPEVERWLAKLEAKDWSERAVAARQLGRLGHPAAIAGLIGALADKEWFVGVRAIEALEAIGDPIALPHVARQAKAPLAPIYDGAARACKTLAGVPRDRGGYVECWQLIDVKAIATEIVGALRSGDRKDSPVTSRYQAALLETLGLLGAREAIPTVRVFTDSRDAAVRDAAEAALGKLTGTGAPPPVEPWERSLRATLRETVPIEFRDLTLAEACARLGKLADIPILVDPTAAAEAGRLSLPKMTVSVEHVIRWLCRFYRCSFVLGEHAILLFRHGEAEGRFELRSYDIATLIMPPRSAGEPSPEDRGRHVAETAAGWCRYIRSAVAAEERGAIAYHDGRLFVAHTEAVHAEIEKLLNDHRKMPSLQVHVLMRFIEIPRAEIEALKLEFQPEDQARQHPPLLRYAHLTNDQTQALMHAVLKKRKGSIICSPQLTCFNTHRASIQAVGNFGHIRRAEGRAEPEIGGVPEGIVFDVQPLISPERRTITLILEPQCPPLAGEVGVPMLDTVVNVPDRGSVLLAPGDFAGPAPRRKRRKDKNILVILLTAETVPDIFEEE
jgi:HEAT repeat protein